MRGLAEERIIGAGTAVETGNRKKLLRKCVRDVKLKCVLKESEERRHGWNAV